MFVVIRESAADLQAYCTSGARVNELPLSIVIAFNTYEWEVNRDATNAIA